MKRGLIVTVAGTGERFNKDLSAPCLKCLFSTNGQQNSLLAKLLSYSNYFSNIIIVGGYKFDDLQNYIKKFHQDKSIKLVFNKNFIDLGSVESLRLGIKAAEEMQLDELIFAEGDLFFDKESFISLINFKGDVVTTNSDPIAANKAVALYIKENGTVSYIYDSLHQSFFINEPFRAIYNSAQVWKFTRLNDLYCINNSLTDKERQGNNLLPINKYFLNPINTPKVIQFLHWINCNTVDDYNKALRLNI